jgi:hypothetical protein
MKCYEALCQTCEGKGFIENPVKHETAKDITCPVCRGAKVQRICVCEESTYPYNPWIDIGGTISYPGENTTVTYTMGPTVQVKEEEEEIN